MAMIKNSIEVSKAVGNKREKIGDVTLFVPDLAEFGITEAPKEVDESGLPVYSTDSANWLFSAILAATKMQARNKLKPSSADLKDGAKIAETLADLMVESERGGNAEYLKAISALKQKFGAWIATLGKSQKAQDLLKTLFTNKAALALQSQENREKFAGYVTDFAATLDEATLATGMRYLNGLIEAAAAAEQEADDF